MAPTRTPDFLQTAKDLARERGRSETEMLAVIADALQRKIAATDSEQIKFHLGLDLQKVENEIGAAMRRDIRRPTRRRRRR